ncbi:MAG: hypothetical protein WEE64_04345 [Dehalococcoidia bacterium]
MPLPAAGPFLTTAVLCEKVLEDKDGVLSAIRIVDRIIQTAVGTEAPDEMPPVPVNLTALISFKSGAARGRHTIKLRPETPAGFSLPETALQIHFEGEDRGANLVLQLGLQANQEGLYWFDVLLDDQLVTRMPLRIMYQRLQTAGAQPPT